MSKYLPHVRVPHAALDLCGSPLERLCIHELYTRADVERGEPFRYSSRDFRCGVIGAGVAKELWDGLEAAGLLVVHEPGVGRRPPLITVSCQERLCSEEPSSEHNGSTTGAQREHNTAADSDGSRCVVGESESAAGAQREHNGSTTGALNARADNNLQPPASKVETRTNVLDPRSFVQQGAGPGEAEPDPVPVPAEKPSPSGRQKAQALWSELQAIRAEHQPGSRGQAATPKRLDNLVARCRDLHRADLGREDLLRALHWLYTSDRPQCRGARDTGDPLKVLLRRSHTVDYCETARDDEAGTTTTAGPEQRPRGSPQPYFDDFDDIRDEIKAEIIDFQARQGG